MVRLTFPYHPEFIKYVKQFPGASFDGSSKTWLMPAELADTVALRARSMGWETDRHMGTYSVADLKPFMGGLHDFQAEAVARTMFEPSHRMILGDDTGLGKTVEAIRIMQASTVRRALIVVPAIVRCKWEDELDRWWPDHPTVGRISSGPERATGLSKAERERLDAAYHADIQIVSYNLLQHAIDMGDLDALVLDEAHKVKDPTLEWSRLAINWSESNPEKCMLALSATPAAEQPLDAIGIAEVVWPGRFGGVHSHYGLQQKCKQRYALCDENEYGKRYYGINPAGVEELSKRFRHMMVRTTKAEVPHLLPAFDVEYELVETETDLVANLSDLKAQLAFYSPVKREAVLGWVELRARSHSHIAVLTDLRASAKELGEKLREDGHEVFVITGAQTPEKRNAILDQAAEADRAIVVATMHSIGIGINLTFCTAAAIAELCYRPEVLLQALGRFSRLSGTRASEVKIFAVKGTVDESIARAVRQKVQAINHMVKAGLGEQALAEQLKSLKSWDELVEGLASGEDITDEYDDYH